MARTIPHRELRNDSAAVLREVQRGETVRVTNHGEVVAVLVPPGNAGADLRVQKATSSKPLSNIARVRLEKSTSELLEELRAE